MIIAEAVVAGTPIPAVARQLVVTRSWASREAHAPETAAMIAKLMIRHKDRLEALFVSALGAPWMPFRAYRQHSGEKVDQTAATASFLRVARDPGTICRARLSRAVPVC